MISLLKDAAVHAVRVSLIITSDLLYETALAIDFAIEAYDNRHQEV